MGLAGWGYFLPGFGFCVSQQKGLNWGLGSVLEKISYWKVVNGIPNEIDFFFLLLFWLATKVLLSRASFTPIEHEIGHY